MKKRSSKKSGTAKKTTAPRTRKPSSIRTNELATLLEEIKNYISTLTEAHDQLNQALDGILNKVNHMEGKLQGVDTMASKITTLEDEVHQTVYGHSERISALEQRAA